MQMIFQAMQGGMNPMQMIQQQAAQNPQLQQLMQICQGKTPEQLRQVAENMCRERGTTYDEVAKNFAQQMGIPYK
jgi:transposase